MTQEQQKHLVTLIIKEITLKEKCQVDSSQIQFNNTVLEYFTNKERIGHQQITYLLLFLFII